MPVVERTFAVPCPCSAVVSVTRGQAGTTLLCPACGAAIEVPRLRDLVLCEAPAAAATGSRPAWDGARGVAFAGATIALLAALAAAVVPAVGGLFVPQPARPDEVRRAVDATPIDTIHAAWTEMAQSGLKRTPSPMQMQFARFTRVARGLSRVLWGVAVAAAVVAAAGFASQAARGRQGAGP